MTTVEASRYEMTSQRYIIYLYIKIWTLKLYTHIDVEQRETVSEDAFANIVILCFNDDDGNDNAYGLQGYQNMSLQWYHWLDS